MPTLDRKLTQRTPVAWLLAAGVALVSAPLLAQRPEAVAAGFDKLFLHDECTGANAEQTDTCLHQQRHEKAFTFGGTAGVVYDVTLRIRGLFEPTTMAAAQAPDSAHPFFAVGGEGKTLDYSQWQISVSEPARVYTLNNYPSVSHTIYKEDFEATIQVASGAKVVVSVSDGNTRQIDNGFVGKRDRQQILEGVTDAPKPGQMLRLDVVRVTARR